jgi:uncharacterized membrane protein YhaH (DUF805 family)
LGFLIGFGGRIGRMQWWLGQLAVLGVLTVGFLSSGFAILQAFLSNEGSVPEILSAQGFGPAILILLATLVVAAVINISTSVKRYHDRDKSGLWCLPAFIPYLGGLWAIWQIIELGMLSGTPGTNRFDTGGGPRRSWDDRDAGSYAGYGDLDAKIAAMKQGAYLATPTAAPAVSYRNPPQSNTSPIQRNPGFGRRGLN